MKMDHLLFCNSSHQYLQAPFCLPLPKAQKHAAESPSSTISVYYQNAYVLIYQIWRGNYNKLNIEPFQAPAYAFSHSLSPFLLTPLTTL